MSAAHERMSLAGGAFVVIALGCAATRLGATPDELTRARGQAEQGAKVYANECAKCHGQRGEGIGSAPAILGPGSLPEFPRNAVNSSDPGMSDPQQLQLEMQSRPAGAAWRDPFRTAQDLFDFTSTRMPKGHPSDVSIADHWAVIGFMLAVQGATLPAGGIGPANASSIQIPRR
jgi:hypothetical protein